jgi:hypothetical protein
MIEGTCLCGSVAWQLEGEPDGATACNCTACRRYGVLWAYGYVDEDIKTIAFQTLQPIAHRTSRSLSVIFLFQGTTPYPI